MYHQLFTRAQKFFIKKRKYFSRSKNKLIIIFNVLFQTKVIEK
ncbi:transporter [Salmonella enterica subsp. enterica serovar Anatum]|nr:transporter [Salmonella enterica subsp. enterica serovar Anatum]